MRQLFAVHEQVVEPEAGGEFALAVFLGDLLVEEAAVSHPAAVVILYLYAVKLPDGIPLPRQEFKLLSGPLVLPKHQHGEKTQHPVDGFLVVAQVFAVSRDGDADAVG